VIKVEGIEKYPESLKIVMTTVEYPIPKVNKIIPGMPRYLRGDCMAINSSSLVTTSVDCEMGLLEDVLLPVSYFTETFSSEILNPFFCSRN